MDNQDEGLSRYSSSDGVNISKGSGDESGSDLVKFFGKVEVIVLNHEIIIKEFQVAFYFMLYFNLFCSFTVNRHKSL